MRQILFRFWDSENKIMAEIGELDGDLEFIKDGDRVRSDLSWQDAFNGDFPEIIPMQLTGMKDRNKKQIYEGDILDHADGNCKVVYSESMAGYDVIFNDEGNLSLWEATGWGKNTLAIIGNIFENPELLQK
jgi:uncharacterized phage protein (TIGR01671 family)